MVTEAMATGTGEGTSRVEERQSSLRFAGWALEGYGIFSFAPSAVSAALVDMRPTVYPGGTFAEWD